MHTSSQFPTLTSALACVQDRQGAYLKELARLAAQQPPTAQGKQVFLPRAMTSATSYWARAWRSVSSWHQASAQHLVMRIVVLVRGQHQDRGACNRVLDAVRLMGCQHLQSPNHFDVSLS